ncbi:trp operon leader peptide [Streptomyces sp. NPDC052043]|uniref:trp operon leader peptide n=1 Tax=Streptomyces sp. NPDC052043 TaxID=3365684 RepID=UPI0037D0AA11
MAYSSVGLGRAANAGAGSAAGRRGPSSHSARPPETGLCCVRTHARQRGRGPSRAGRGRPVDRCGRVPGMFAHSTQNQNWWWTASPAAR